MTSFSPSHLKQPMTNDNIERVISEVAARRSISPGAAAWLAGQENENHGPVLSSAYEQVVWVYRAVNALAEQVANIPFLFSAGERGRETLISSGPLIQFYDRPHPHLNRFQYWELRVIWLMLRGECFRIPIYSDDPNLNHNLDLNRPVSSSRNTEHGARSRKLRRVLMLDPSHMHHVVENHELIGWRYIGIGQQAPLESQVFLPEEVWFEKLTNPFNFWS